ncbi:MAG TPA: hypothetical protein VIV11_11480 [Kofleriaceae bacterium]
MAILCSKATGPAARCLSSMRGMYLIGLLGSLLAVSEARADCGFPQWMGTADGTAVPSRGSLYIYDESLSLDDHAAQPRAEVTWSGGEQGSVRFTRVEDAVARLDYEGPVGATMTVALRQWDETFAYQLVDWWKPSEIQPRVVHYWHNTDEWTCSWADSLMIQLDQRVAAVRARWTYNQRAVEWTLPPRTQGSKVVVELGKVNCGGATIPPEQLVEGGELELVAIRFDGSQIPITGLPKRISTTMIGKSSVGLGSALTLVSIDDAPRMKRRSRPGQWIGFVALTLLGAGLLIGWRLAGRSANGCSQALR